MTFEFTSDMELVRRILTEPRCWRRMVNDYAPLAECFEVRPAASISYVAGFNGQDARALFVLVTGGEPVETHVHFCFDPELWGGSEEIGRQFLAWTWKCTTLKRLVAPVPSYNRLALKLARAVGFEDFDIQVGALKRRGKEYDLMILELKRPEATHAAVA